MGLNLDFDADMAASNKLKPFLNSSCAVTIMAASTLEIISSMFFSTIIPKTSVEEKYGSCI